MPPHRASSLRHVRPVVPLHFPVQEPEDQHLGQSKRHQELCIALYQVMARVAGAQNTIGGDQYVYYDAANPRRCLAPDAFVKLGIPNFMFDTYKTWEHGAPELCIEVLSPSDTPETWPWREKLRRYRQLGVRELAMFDVDARPGKRLRIWDRLDEDLVERVVEGDRSPCLTLGLWFFVAPLEGHEVAPRLACDPEGTDLVLTPSESSRLFEERARAGAEHARAEAERARAAEARAAELEAELARLRAEGR